MADDNGELSSDYYTVEYSNNINPGTATVKVTLKGDYYEGEKKLTFTIQAVTYTVTFLDGLGNTLKTEVVERGKDASAPSNPKRDGYQFAGWDKDFSNIRSDLIVTAKWEKLKETPAGSSSRSDTAADTGTGSGPIPGAPFSIKGAKVILSKTAFTYNGKVQKPDVKSIGGKLLAAGRDYTASWTNSSSKNAGTYVVTITGRGNYTGTTKATYRINKANNPVKIRSKPVLIKYLSLKKKNQRVRRVKGITVSRAKGRVRYKFAGTDKKRFKKYFRVNVRNGNITVKRGLRKGVFKIKVKIRAAGNTNYKSSGWKSTTIRIHIK